MAQKLNCLGRDTASFNSFPMLQTMQLPNNQILDYGEISAAQIEGFLADAAAVSKSIIRSFVSLSVISPEPEQSPRLREIYSSGNTGKQATEHWVKDDKNVNYLILISNNFMEAHAALSHHGLSSVPAPGSHQGIDFGTHLVPPIQETWSDEDMWIIRNIISEPLPTSQHETRARYIPSAIELLMEEKWDDDDGTSSKT